MAWIAQLVTALAMLLAMGAPAVVHAQATVQEAAPAAVPGLSVARNDAAVDFPTGINFSLDASTTGPVTDVELMYRTPGIETYSVELPQFDHGSTALNIQHQLDLRAGDLPPGVDVQYHWRITEANGDVVETPEQTLLWGDDRYDWKSLAGPHVTVYTYTGDDAFRKSILDAAERTIDHLKQAYGTTPNQPIRIWAYANKDDFYGALPPNSEQWIAGADFPDIHLILAILPPSEASEVSRVVPHEISHQVLHQATLNPFNSPPQWLDEGLAEYWQESGRDRFYSYALQLAASGKMVPLRTLNSPFAYDRQDATAAYALSLSAVMYILDTWGDDGMAHIIATFPKGVTYDEAIQQGLGISFDELDRRWREDLAAKAKQSGVTGATRFGDDAASPPPWSDIGQGTLLASGTLVMALVVLIALAGRWLKRRGAAPVDPTPENLRWREWPDGLEPPGWQMHSS
jgi:hypothetical protein